MVFSDDDGDGGADGGAGAGDNPGFGLSEVLSTKNSPCITSPKPFYKEGNRFQRDKTLARGHIERALDGYFELRAEGNQSLGFH